MIKYQRTTTCELKKLETSFNLTDEKGRAIGYRIVISVCTYKEAVNTVCWYSKNPAYIAETCVTRNGVHFGATTSELTADTLKDINAKAEARRANALIRYTKKYS